MLRDSPCRPIRLLAAGAACIALSGCYYIHLAEGQMEMNRKREPIEDVIASPDTDATLRRRLELAARARDFAMSDLGLPDNGSYRTYADLGRRYVTWNLFAAPEFSVRPKEWCFPIAGCVTYRGYFDEPRATKGAGKLRGKGYDVFVGPSIAYSTLGHLRDPVLNTMFGYGDSELAAFIFHELAHQEVYAPGDSDFNEAFATVVETEGLERWLAHENRSADLDRFLAARKGEREAADRMVATRHELATLYREKLDPAVMRERKAAEFAKLRDSLTSGGHELNGDFNNARLVAVATYERCVPALRAELDKVGNDLPAFYAAMTTLAHDTVARAQICPPS
jgi:predicted aminopeptidase